MGLFRRKKKVEEEFDIEELDMDEILNQDSPVNFDEKMFDAVSRTQYIKTQCEQIIESSQYVENTRREYESVTKLLKDIQIIDNLEPEERKKVSDIAEETFNLDRERNVTKKKQSRLPSNKFNYYLEHEEDLVEALKKMQNDEQYFQMVKKDLSMLEAEKVSLKGDIEDSIHTQGNLRKLSIVFLVLAMMVLAVLIVQAINFPEDSNYLFTIILFIVAVFVVVVFLANRKALYTIKISEKKLNRAIVIQNKVKIKYINIVNSIEYQYAKYGVHNSYEFSNNYQMFLEDKKDREIFQRTTGRLGATSDELTKCLSGFGLYDADVWQNQLEALFNPKEMVEVRHSLNARRQKLREQMDYNVTRIDEAKKNVTAYIKKNPQYADEIMAIVDSYDMENAGE